MLHIEYKLRWLDEIDFIKKKLKFFKNMYKYKRYFKPENITYMIDYENKVFIYRLTVPK